VGQGTGERRYCFEEGLAAGLGEREDVAEGERKGQEIMWGPRKR
jgi:hypothetical protein